MKFGKFVERRELHTFRYESSNMEFSTKQEGRGFNSEGLDEWESNNHRQGSEKA
jgi:hypothetical protein